MAEGSNRVTLLPEQLRYLSAIANQTGAAIGVTQDGSSVLHIDTGFEQFDIDPNGNKQEN